MRAQRENNRRASFASKLKTPGWAFLKKSARPCRKVRPTRFAGFVGISGAGLGLAIAKRLVEMMNRKIGLDSGADGKGSLAWFTLPLAKVASISERKRRREAEAIIIVEDNVLVAKFFRMALERAGGFSCMSPKMSPPYSRKLNLERWI